MPLHQLNAAGTASLPSLCTTFKYLSGAGLALHAASCCLLTTNQALPLQRKAPRSAPEPSAATKKSQRTSAKA